MFSDILKTMQNYIVQSIVLFQLASNCLLKVINHVKHINRKLIQFEVITASCMMYIYPVESLAILYAIVELSIESSFQSEAFDKVLARFHWILPVQNEKMFFDWLLRWFLNFLLIYKI